MKSISINIKLLHHESSGMIVAVSEELKGLMVHGKTPEEIEQRLPIAIKDICEVKFNRKVSVTRVADEAVGSFRKRDEMAFIAGEVAAA